MEMSFRPLEGRVVRLEPLTSEHKEVVQALVDCDPGSWSIMPVNPVGGGFEECWTAISSAPLTDRMSRSTALWEPHCGPRP
jgi:N-acetyltransferase